ncbi:class I SAM-dependent methyltransferase [Agromyces sp. LHK192]|uniref:class I SAM-dependent methyltransferase n=1 Tax=Agromyces sp. LHK192 TaxID=2498704 RepID=UPI000FD80981|nr:methyltransferase [Agromyces sp. LHK192]
MDFSALRRFPDVDGPGLEASDAADRLILDEAAALVASGAAADPATTDAPVAVIGDTHGALAVGAAAVLGAREVRAHQDALLGERAIAANAERMGAAAVRVGALDDDLVRDARLVLLRLPRSLDQLDEQAELIARHAAHDVVVVAGGRIKHMSLAMNDVLGRWFGRIDVTHARQKSRVLLARGPRTGDVATAAVALDGDTWPRRRRDRSLGVEIVAHGGVFAGAAVDIGTRFLLEHLDAAIGAAVGGAADPGRLGPVTAVDLGCGTGVVAVELARRYPEAVVVATDQSAAAARSAAETAAANGLADRIDVHRADALEFATDASVDLVVLNPPFHAGAAITTALAERLFAESGRALRPGGRLVAVWNSHLRHRPSLERLVGPTVQVARNPKFTVTVSTRA